MVCVCVYILRVQSQQCLCPNVGIRYGLFSTYHLTCCVCLLKIWYTWDLEETREARKIFVWFLCVNLYFIEYQIWKTQIELKRGTWTFGIYQRNFYRIVWNRIEISANDEKPSEMNRFYVLNLIQEKIIEFLCSTFSLYELRLKTSRTTNFVYFSVKNIKKYFENRFFYSTL